MLKINTPTRKLSKKQKSRIVALTIKWCRSALGENNKRKNKLGYCLRPQPLMHKLINGECHGQFDYRENILDIYIDNNKSIKSLIITTIHEYTHHLQPIRKRYYELDKKYGYWKNPFEIQAHANEVLYENCWREIKKKI